MIKLEDLKKDLKKRLSKKRYEHCLRVADESVKLAKIYNISEEKAYIAGLLHDIAKEFSLDENKEWLLKIGKDYLLSLEFKRIIHSEVGALVVKELYNLDDSIINAIRYHNIGNINMDMLAKIVFVADKIESGKDYPGIEEERVLAYQNIDEALLLCLKNHKKKRESEGKNIHPDSVMLMDYLEKNKV